MTPPPDKHTARARPVTGIMERLRSRDIRLNTAQGAALDAFVEQLEHWNARINLTGAREREELMERHILDCLMLETLEAPEPLADCVDLGSGGGLPGIVLAIMHPELRVTLVEKSLKKSTFLAQVSRALKLDNVTVLREQVARVMARHREGPRFGLVTARAYAPLRVLLPQAGGLLRPGGRLWAMKGVRWRDELDAVPREALAAFAGAPEVHEYTLAPGAQPGVILVWRRGRGEQDPTAPGGRG